MQLLFLNLFEIMLVVEPKNAVNVTDYSYKRRCLKEYILIKENNELSKKTPAGNHSSCMN